MEEKIPSVLRSVRLKCLDCSCGSVSEVTACPVEACPLHPFRFGKNPNRNGTRVMTEEQKQASKDRLLAYHAKRKSSKELPE
jgi:hypothetical protein